MNARELRDSWRDATLNGRFYGNISVLVDGASISTILRALDLLAGVEESGDELVRLLGAFVERLYGHERPDPLEVETQARIVEEAAARIVALETENARLRGHAEVMATKHEAIRTAGVRNIDRAEAELHEAVEAYRADKGAK